MQEYMSTNSDNKMIALLKFQTVNINGKTKM